MSLLDKFLTVRAQTTEICSPLLLDDYSVQPHQDVSPPKWHLGHTTWFFEKLILAENDSGYQAVDENYYFIFNSYYESLGERLQRPRRGVLSRPTLEAVLEYRKIIDQKITEVFPRLSADLLERFEIGIEHEMQHQELLFMDIKYILASSPMDLQYHAFEEKPAPAALDRQFRGFEGGLVEVGNASQGFAFDNERPQHKVYLEPFELATRCVTNGEFLDFIKNSAYERAEFWLSDGWHWVNTNGVDAPLYWRKKGESWQQFGFGGWQDLDLNAPVSHVSFYEADAYCNWAGVRLPTEFEWEHASQLVPACDWGFADCSHPGVKPSSEDFADLHGCLWQWTRSAYLPYPRSKPFSGALAEYNSKFMLNQMVLRGGSYGTPAKHYRPTYRNFFYPHQRWAFTGIRIAKDQK